MLSAYSQLAHSLRMTCYQITLNLLVICSQQVFNSFTSCFQPSYILAKFPKSVQSSREELLSVLEVGGCEEGWGELC